MLSFLFPWAHINVNLSTFRTITTSDCYLFIWGGPTYCENKTYIYESHGWLYGEWRWKSKSYSRFIIILSQFIGVILWVPFIYGFNRVKSELKKTKEKEEIMRKALKEGLKAVLKAETKPKIIGLPPCFAIAVSLVMGFISIVLVNIEVSNFKMIAFANIPRHKRSLKNMFFLTPLASKPSNGESLLSCSPHSTFSSKYSSMYVIICCGTNVNYWCLALLRLFLIVSMDGTLVNSIPSLWILASTKSPSFKPTPPS